MVARFATTGVPTALAASLVAAWPPTALIQLAIACLLLGFVAHECLAGERAAAPSISTPWLAAGAGAIAGTVSGLTGGAGFVVTPLFDKLGLEPKALVATTSVCMGLVHLTKGLGFGASAVLPPALRRLLLGALALAAVQLLVTAIGRP